MASPPPSSGNDALRQAMALHRAGRLQEADERYAAVLRAEPRQAQALRLRGILARDTGHHELSLKLLRKAADAAPADPEPAAELGLSCLAAGYLQLAEAAFRKALARDPDSGKALANLGALLQYRGHAQAAIDCHRRVLELDPDDLEVRCNLATTLVEAGRGDEALVECDAALVVAPGEPGLLATKGAVLVGLGRHADAAPLLEAALEAGPDDMALINLGLARQALGQPGQAIAVLETAVRVNPDNARATADLTALLSAEGRSEAALRLSDDFLKRHPGERLVLASRGVALRDAGQAEQARALIDLERLVRISELPVPRGFTGIAEFNGQLATLLRGDPSLLASPLSKATRGGAQTGELDPDSSPILGAFRDTLNAELRTLVGELRREGFAGHPVMAWAAERWTLRLWGTLLAPGGHQLPHLHPLAWLSGVYYVEVPPGLGTDGALEFGEPPPGISARVGPERRRISATPGRLVVFPSWFWHRTLPFTQPGERISLAFDVMPLATGACSPGRPVVSRA
ncbi:MAG: tetratricopeptide repeat protein [Chromatiales bacterium]|nr:tetratricopeptide repeat protein [Chromatiales bacterium]